MISSDYTMTFGYGRTDPPYGTAQYPYHRGDDWYMPDGTPIVVNGVQIGVSGHTGFVTGPHCHIGRFVNGGDTNPESQGWTLTNPHVTDIGYDDTDGNYVGLLDSAGVRWVYLHMQEKSTNVKVGDYLDQLPKYEGDDMSDIADLDFVRTVCVGMTDLQPETNQNFMNNVGLDKDTVVKNFLNYTEARNLRLDAEAYRKGSVANLTTLKPGNYKVGD